MPLLQCCYNAVYNPFLRTCSLQPILQSHSWSSPILGTYEIICLRSGLPSLAASALGRPAKLLCRERRQGTHSASQIMTELNYITWGRSISLVAQQPISSTHFHAGLHLGSHLGWIYSRACLLSSLWAHKSQETCRLAYYVARDLVTESKFII